jgi:hypothetical protein
MEINFAAVCARCVHVYTTRGYEWLLFSAEVLKL